MWASQLTTSVSTTSGQKLSKMCFRRTEEKSKQTKTTSNQHVLKCNSWIVNLYSAITKVYTAIRASQERNCSSEIHPGQGMITGSLTNMSELIKHDAHKYQQIFPAI